VDLHVGDRLRQLRERLRLSEAMLAGELALSTRQLRNYERGENQLSVRTLYRISRHLGAPIGYFFEGLSPVNDG